MCLFVRFTPYRPAPREGGLLHTQRSPKGYYINRKEGIEPSITPVHWHATTTLYHKIHYHNIHTKLWGDVADSTDDLKLMTWLSNVQFTPMFKGRVLRSMWDSAL